MTLGCAFILIVLLWFWRRRARRHREKKTKTFAREKNLDGVHGWFVRLGQRLFRNKRNDLPPELPVKYARDSLHSPRIQPIEHDMLLRKLAPPKSETGARSVGKRDSIDDLLSAYGHSVASRATSYSSADTRRRHEDLGRSRSRIDQDSQSLYSAVTGRQRWTPDPRQFQQKDPVTVRGSIGSSVFVPTLPPKPPMKTEDVHPIILTDAQAYMQAVRPTTSGDTGFSSYPQVTPSPIPIPTYVTGPNFSRPIAPTSSGAVPLLSGGNRPPIPETLTGNRGPYMTTSGANRVSQPPYLAISAHNPFRNRA
jgi:hypothetical protein